MSWGAKLYILNRIQGNSVTELQRGVIADIRGTQVGISRNYNADLGAKARSISMDSESTLSVFLVDDTEIKYKITCIGNVGVAK